MGIWRAICSGIKNEIAKANCLSPCRNGHHDRAFIKKMASLNCQRFSFEDISRATNQFDEQKLIGEGGFGRVFKGSLADGREIAAKRLSRMSDRSRKSFKKEALLLSKMKHDNLVELLGYCIENDEFILVYEYLANNSVRKILSSSKGKKLFNWYRRANLMQQSAEAVSYLHKHHHLIHRDLKASNVLVSANWTAKVADLGLGRPITGSKSSNSTEDRAGTIGFKAPELVFKKRFSEKTDSYSFGAFMLEVITGREINDRPDGTDLLVWAYKNFYKGRISQIIDPALADSADMDQVKDFIGIALRCVEDDKNGRPSMETVAFMLQSILKNEIGKPGTYRYEGSDQSEPQTSEEAKAIEHMSAADEHQIQSQRGLSNANQIIKEGQVKKPFTGVKILEILPFGVPESQHGPSNSNDIMVDNPVHNSSAFPPRDESVGTSMPTGINNLLSLLEPSADKEKRIPQPSSPEAIVDQPEMKEPESQEHYEYPEINEESDEIIREIQLLVENKIETQKKLEQVSLEFEELSKEWRNGNLAPQDIRRLSDPLMKITTLKERLAECEKAIERCESEKLKRIPKNRDLHGAILTTQNEILEGKVKRSKLRWSPRRLKVSRERIQMLDTEVEEYHQSMGRPAGSQALNFYKMRTKEDYLEQIDFDIWHLQSSKNNPFSDLKDIEDSMNKLDQEMALSYGQLKTLVHKFKKGKPYLPSILASLLESHEKGKEIVELDEEKSYMEVEQNMREIMKDIGEGIEHVDHYIKALTKWNKGFQMINDEGLKGATTKTQTSKYKSWSEQINAQQALGDSRLLGSW